MGCLDWSGPEERVKFAVTLFYVAAENVVQDPAQMVDENFGDGFGTILAEDRDPSQLNEVSFVEENHKLQWL